MTAMHIDLDPPLGITGFPLGMPAEDLKRAAAALGRVTVDSEGSAARFSPMKVGAFHPQFEIIFHLEDGKTLTAAEVWIPREGPEDITVTWRGIDVFRTPARALMAQVEAAGHAVHDRERYHPMAPGLSLGFTRDAGHDVPMADDDMPLYFQAVLVAPEGYYDALLAELAKYAV